MKSFSLNSFLPLLLNRAPSVFNRMTRNHHINQSIDQKFVLSFDCDSNEDAEVSLMVTERLIKMGIVPVFAVPAQLLQKNLSAYRAIRNLGCEFMNHGYRQHTYRDFTSPIWRSSFFYNKVPFDEVKRDIQLADKVLSEFLDERPKGFRAPHFGTCAGVLPKIYEVLIELEYTYSSSATPFSIAKHGYTYSRSGLTEFPTTGRSLQRPCNCLDSYNSVVLTKNPDEYYSEVASIVESGVPFVNLYVDPAHVLHSNGFWKAMALLVNHYEVTNYSAILAQEKFFRDGRHDV
jgi:hypothetical protein